MRAPRLITATALAVALAAAPIVAVAAPASADSTVAGYINVSATSVSAKAYGKAGLTIATNIVDPTYSDPEYGGFLDGVVVAKGKSYPVSTITAIPTSGVASVDLVSFISRAAFDYGDVPPGTYSVTFSDADGQTLYNADYSDKTTITGAVSPTVTVKVSKVKTTIKGWSTHTRTLRSRGKLALPKFTISGAGKNAKVTVQYRKGTRGPWRTVRNGSYTTYTTGTVTLKAQKFNILSISHGRSTIFTHGTYYLRTSVKGTAFATGYTTRSLKVVVR